MSAAKVKPSQQAKAFLNSIDQSKSYTFEHVIQQIFGTNAAEVEVMWAAKVIGPEIMDPIQSGGPLSYTHIQKLCKCAPAKPLKALNANRVKAFQGIVQQNANQLPKDMQEQLAKK